MLQTRIKDFTLKRATKEDSDLIFHFVKQLAIYEKMLDELEGTPEMIMENIFDNKQAEVLIAYYQGKPVGSCLYFISFSTFLCRGGIYIEDIYIEEEYRNMGFGKEIFYQMAKLAKEEGFGRIEWVCIDWNEPSIKFYENTLGAKALREWIRFRLDEEAIDNLLEKK